MKYAIIAAGDGSRLSREGWDVPKPLVEIGGEKLVDRLIRIFIANEATDITVICNERMNQVSDHLEALSQTISQACAVQLHIISTHTPSSMHSLHAMRAFLDDDAFCLTTVDTIFNAHDFARYIQSFKQALTVGVDALMGVTRLIDDEKPLYVATDDTMRINGFFDTSVAPHQYVSGGIYGFQPIVFNTLERCIERGEQRMRNFQRALLADGLDVRAFDFGKVYDIDHVTDIAKAQAFVMENE